MDHINQDLEREQSMLEGFEARLYQHFMDYLQGFPQIRDIEASEDEFQIKDSQDQFQKYLAENEGVL